MVHSPHYACTSQYEPGYISLWQAAGSSGLYQLSEEDIRVKFIGKCVL